MKCSNCGNEIANDSLFCEYCGTQIIKDEVKRIDIRWCLLPAMIIATIAMGFASESWDILLHGGYDHNVEPFFVIPLCLFLISCWYGIKKVVPPSFVITIVILFGINCKILYDSVHTRDSYKYSVNISWSHDYDVYGGGYGGITLGSFYNYSWKNEEKVKEELLRCALALKEELKEKGSTIGEGSIYREMFINTGWKGYNAFFIVLIITLVYLIYTFIAHKKGWKF